MIAADLHRIQAYLRVAAPRGRDHARIGPFLATFTRESDNPYLNYAIPDDGAAPQREEIDALVAAYTQRNRKPRFEYIPAIAPKLEAALLDAGFEVEARTPLMVYGGKDASIDEPEGIEIATATSNEDLQDAAWRTLARETGLRTLPDGIHLEQLATYGRPNRDPRTRVVSVAYLALTPDIPLPHIRVSSGRVRFWPVTDLDGDDAPPLAFDHAQIVRDAVERARARLEYTTVALAFLEESLTLADLRHVYETVWGVTLDPSNFRRKVLDTPGFLVPLGGEVRREHGVGRGRPGELYRKGTAFWLERVVARPRPSAAAEPRAAVGRDDRT